tara:strand:+ start:633 stop:1253 length:621 start_codon:yes stop_codon:yes gene_type:complete
MFRKKILILDYGSGNVKSVFNISKYIEEDVIISNKIEEIKKSTHIILPGVGSFKTSMEKINKNLPIDEILKEIEIKKKPILGICVGMQVMASFGYEFEKCKGLNLIEGDVKKIEAKNFPLPNIGWNEVVIKKDSLLLKNINEKDSFYFVHSYEFKPINISDIISETYYENIFASSIQRENKFGVQFHPEKSQKSGIKLLKNFFHIN